MKFYGDFNRPNNDIRTMSKYLQYIKTRSPSSYFILQILYGLPNDYSDTVTIMIAHNPLPSDLELCSFLLAHESHLHSCLPPSTSIQAFVTHHDCGFSSRHQHNYSCSHSDYFQTPSPSHRNFSYRPHFSSLAHPSFYSHPNSPPPSLIGHVPSQSQLCNTFYHII